MGRECSWEQRTSFNYCFEILCQIFLNFYGPDSWVSSFGTSYIDITLICLVWFKLWFVMLPVCIHFEVLVFPVKMMNRWDYFRNCELYLTRFWHFGAFSLPVSLSPVETFTQSHSLRIYMNLLIEIQHLNRNMKMVHTISQQIIQRYSHEFAESWVTDSQNYHDLRFSKSNFLWNKIQFSAASESAWDIISSCIQNTWNS